ncbi:hypothetical protein AC579_6493 [Pseudocercospora musae]|uniref:Uncharacterized protein n=1 Tax=Pseudocercospora musae TaxID=113226 RepID=A0A139IAD8_9PEZI|nr:hypothetical protein AC579_6493 [Pseudocercospora musae]
MERLSSKRPANDHHGKADVRGTWKIWNWGYFHITRLPIDKAVQHAFLACLCAGLLCLITAALSTNTDLGQLSVDSVNASDSAELEHKNKSRSAEINQIEGVRDDLEGPLHPRLPERPSVMIRHAFTAKFHTIKTSEVNTKLFKNINILEPLKELKGVAVYVDIRGDLPQEYIDQTPSNPGKAA